MRELQRKDGLTRAEHRELDQLETKFDEELDGNGESEPEPKEPEPKEPEPKEPEPKEPEPKEPEPKEPEPKEPEPKEQSKPKLIKPENDHWYFKDRSLRKAKS